VGTGGLCGPPAPVFIAPLIPLTLSSSPQGGEAEGRCGVSTSALLPTTPWEAGAC
jgi:hypothetical protein